MSQWSLFGNIQPSLPKDGPLTQSKIPPCLPLQLRINPVQTLLLATFTAVLPASLPLPNTLASWNFSVFRAWCFFHVTGSLHVLSGMLSLQRTLRMCKLFFKEVPQYILGEVFPDCLRSSYSFLWVFMILHGSIISCIIIMSLPTVSLSRAGSESYSCFYPSMVLTTSSCSLNDRLISEWIDQWTDGWMVSTL